MGKYLLWLGGGGDHEPAGCQRSGSVQVFHFSVHYAGVSGPCLLIPRSRAVCVGLGAKCFSFRLAVLYTCGQN